MSEGKISQTCIRLLASGCGDKAEELNRTTSYINPIYPSGCGRLAASGPAYARRTTRDGNETESA